MDILPELSSATTISPCSSRWRVKTSSLRRSVDEGFLGRTAIEGAAEGPPSDAGAGVLFQQSNGFGFARARQAVSHRCGPGTSSRSSGEALREVDIDATSVIPDPGDIRRTIRVRFPASARQGHRHPPAFPTRRPPDARRWSRPHDPTGLWRISTSPSSGYVPLGSYSGREAPGAEWTPPSVGVVGSSGGGLVPPGGRPRAAGCGPVRGRGRSPTAAE